MQSKISCSAGKLSLLQPDMIQQIVADVAFKSGSQYEAEKRVRITSSDDGHVASSVTGNFWMHEQDIRLKDGFLVASCSCRVEEQPICRHAIAALLAYHKSLPPPAKKAAEKARREAVILEASVVETLKTIEPIIEAAAEPDEVAEVPPSQEATVKKSLSPREPAKPTAPAKDLKFSEIAMFIEWLQPTVEALKQGDVMHDMPKTAHGEIEEWIKVLLGLQAQKAQSEANQGALRKELAALKADFVEKSGQLDRIAQQLQVATRDAKDAQAACKEMQSNLARCHSIIAGLQDLSKQLDQCEGQIRVMGEELAKKKSQYDILSGSFKDIASALRPLGKAAASIGL